MKKFNTKKKLLVLFFLSSLIVFYIYTKEEVKAPIYEQTYYEELKKESVKTKEGKINLNSFIEENSTVIADEIIDFHFNSGDNFIEWKKKNAPNATFSTKENIILSNEEEEYEVNLQNNNSEKTILVSFFNQPFGNKVFSFIKTIDSSFEKPKRQEVYFESLLKNGPFITATDSNILSVKQIKKLKGKIVEITIEILDYETE